MEDLGPVTGKTLREETRRTIMPSYLQPALIYDDWRCMSSTISIS